MQNSLVKMGVAFPNCGCVTSIMTVEMILMNQHINVVSRTVQMVGNVVQVALIIDAFPSGCSVMERMIVEMDLMSCQRTVQNAMKLVIFNARIIVVYQSKLMNIILDSMAGQFAQSSSAITY